MRRLIVSLACSFLSTAAVASVTPAQVVKHYADLASVEYQEALDQAKLLQKAVNKLIEKPSEASLQAARQAWISARVPYQQTEVFRFGNPVVDEWEGKVNAWPLDEGMIDYVDASYGSSSDMNAYYVVNVIANTRLSIGGKTVNTEIIDAALLRDRLHEADGNEANVATGYHAIEFLLWGQDLNGTGPAPEGSTGSPQQRHAGNRPYTDYDMTQCTGGNCDRRTQYLRTATDLLVQDLEEIVGAWQENGAARQHIVGDASNGLRAMLTGLGSLSYGELAGERMKLGLMLHDPEEEHDCFSDNTHNSHYYNQLGIVNVYLGQYKKVDGSAVSGPSLSQLVHAADPKLDAEVRARLDATLKSMQAIRDRAATVETYDQMIAQGNTEGNAVVQAAIDALIAQTRSLERVITALDLGNVNIEGSESLDSPSAVFK